MLLVGDMVRRNAARYPDKTGVVFEERRFTWQEVNMRVNSLAHGLLKLGLEKQSRVAILSRNCNEYLEFYLAVAKAGLIGVALNPMFKAGELGYLIDDSGSDTLIVDSYYEDKVASMQSELHRIKHYIGIGPGHSFPYDFETIIAENPTRELEVEVDENDIFVLAYSSGTTGRPKGAMITHRNCVTAAVVNAMEYGMQPYHVYALPGAFYFATCNGARLVPIVRGCTTVITTWDPEELLPIIEKERVWGYNGGPTVHSRIVNHPDFEKYDVSSIGFIAVTTSPCSTSLWRKLEEIFGHVCYACFGMTESTKAGPVLHPAEIATEGSEKLVRRMSSVGRSAGIWDIRVVNESGEDVAWDMKEIGELIMKGDHIMKGYWNDPQMTAETIRDGWLYTGDLATVDEDGYIYIVDRRTDMIKSGGINVYPREIEEVIYTHPAVSLAAVIGVPDERWGETVKAVVVLKPNAKATEEDIIELCKIKLASYKKPTSIDFVDSMPLTAGGKILKRELKKKYWEDYDRLVH